ncbi:mucin-5AC [Drosophila persimilis]|uniref:mucin-5AC n=1 Tax=Drosophila persimilis TaxID=7234 RepID=UPI000F091648|nr:mucin-5AC [Drosophila persimilis]
MAHSIWLLLVALLTLVNSRSIRQLPSGYSGGPQHHPLLPNGYYGQPFAYQAPYGYGYQAPPPVFSPPGSYYDSVYGVYKPFPGGGIPVRIDYNNRCSRNYVGIKPHPDQQEYYYVCQPNCVIFSKCPKLESFNSSSGRCVHRVQPQAPPCVKEGRFAHPSDCRVYYRCDKNESLPWLFGCPSGTIFSPLKKKCIPGDECPSTEISNSGSYIPVNCEIKFPECTEEGTFRSPTDCALYYTCKLQESGNYLQTRFKCPGSNSYDPQRRLCRPQSEVRCHDYVPVPQVPYPPLPHFYPYPAPPTLYEEDDYDTASGTKEQGNEQSVLQSGKVDKPSVNVVILPTTTTTTASPRIYPSYEYPPYQYGSEPAAESLVEEDSATIRSKPSVNIVVLPTTPKYTSKGTTKYQYKRYTYSTAKNNEVTEAPEQMETLKAFKGHLSERIVILPTSSTPGGTSKSTTVKRESSTEAPSNPTMPTTPPHCVPPATPTAKPATTSTTIATTDKPETTTQKSTTTITTTPKPTKTTQEMTTEESTTQKPTTTRKPATTPTLETTTTPKSTTTLMSTTITSTTQELTTTTPKTSTITTRTPKTTVTTPKSTTATSTTQKLTTTTSKTSTITTTTSKTTVTTPKSTTITSTTQELTTTTPKTSTITTTNPKTTVTTPKSTTITSTTQELTTTNPKTSTITTTTPKTTVTTPKSTTIASTTQELTTTTPKTSTITTRTPKTTVTTPKSTTATSTTQKLTTTTPKTSTITTTTSKTTVTTPKSTTITSTTQKLTTTTPKTSTITTTTPKTTVTTPKSTTITTTTQELTTTTPKTSTITTTTLKTTVTTPKSTTITSTTQELTTTTPKTSTITTTTPETTATTPKSTTITRTTQELTTTTPKTSTITTQTPKTTVTTPKSTTITSTTQKLTTTTPKTSTITTTTPKSTTVTSTTQKLTTTTPKTSTITTTAPKTTTTTPKSTTITSTTQKPTTTTPKTSTITTTTVQTTTTTPKSTTITSTTQKPTTTTSKTSTITTTTAQPSSAPSTKTTSPQPSSTTLQTTTKLTTQPSTKTTAKRTTVEILSTSTAAISTPTTTPSSEETTVTKPACPDHGSTEDTKTHIACTQQNQLQEQEPIQRPQELKNTNTNTELSISKNLFVREKDMQEHVVAHNFVSSELNLDYMDDAALVEVDGKAEVDATVDKRTTESPTESPTTKESAMSTMAAAHLLEKLFHVISTPPPTTIRTPTPSVTLAQLARHNLATSKPFIAESLRLSIKQLASTHKRSIQQKSPMMVALNSTKEDHEDSEYYDSETSELYEDRANDVVEMETTKAMASTTSAAVVPALPTSPHQERVESTSTTSSPLPHHASTTMASDSEYADNYVDSDYVNDEAQPSGLELRNDVFGEAKSLDTEAHKRMLMRLLKEKLTHPQEVKMSTTTTESSQKSFLMSLLKDRLNLPKESQITTTSTETPQKSFVMTLLKERLSRPQETKTLTRPLQKSVPMSMLREEPSDPEEISTSTATPQTSTSPAAPQISTSTAAAHKLPSTAAPQISTSTATAPTFPFPSTGTNTTAPAEDPARNSSNLSSEYYEDEDYDSPSDAESTDQVNATEGSVEGKKDIEQRPGTAKRHSVLPGPQQAISTISIENELAMNWDEVKMQSRPENDGFLLKALPIRGNPLDISTASSIKHIQQPLGLGASPTEAPRTTQKSAIIIESTTLAASTTPIRIETSRAASKIATSVSTIAPTTDSTITPTTSRRPTTVDDESTTTPTAEQAPTTPPTPEIRAESESELITATRHKEVLRVNSMPWLLEAQNQTVHLTPISIATKYGNPVTHDVNRSFNPLVSNPGDYATEKVPELILKVFEPIDLKIVFCPKSCEEDHDHKYDPADNYKKPNCLGSCDDDHPPAHHSVDLKWKPLTLKDTASFQTIT